MKLLQEDILSEAKHPAKPTRDESGLTKIEDEKMLKKKLNNLRDKIERRKRELKSLQDKMNEVALKSSEPTEEIRNHKRICVLQNNLDLVTIKFHEASSIRKVYESILKKLKEERIDYNNLLKAVEKELRRADNELLDQTSIYNEANQSRAQAHSFLSTLESQRTKTAGERNRFLTAKRQKMEDRMRRLQAKTSPVTDEDIQFDRNSSKVTPFDIPSNKLGNKDFDLHERNFKELYDATGAKDINEICQRLIAQDETVESLQELKLHYTHLIESKKQEREALKEKLLTGQGQGSTLEASSYRSQLINSMTTKNIRAIGGTGNILGSDEGDGSQKEVLHFQKLDFETSKLNLELTKTMKRLESTNSKILSIRLFLELLGQRMAFLCPPEPMPHRSDTKGMKDYLTYLLNCVERLGEKVSLDKLEEDDNKANLLSRFVNPLIIEDISVNQSEFRQDTI